MVIKKIINNNIVSSIDQYGGELVVMGRGIGFGKKPGQEINDAAVEKIFRMDNKDNLERFKRCWPSCLWNTFSYQVISFLTQNHLLKLN